MLDSILEGQHVELSTLAHRDGVYHLGHRRWPRCYSQPPCNRGFRLDRRSQCCVLERRGRDLYAEWTEGRVVPGSPHRSALPLDQGQRLLSVCVPIRCVAPKAECEHQERDEQALGLGCS